MSMGISTKVNINRRQFCQFVTFYTFIYAYIYFLADLIAYQLFIEPFIAFLHTSKPKIGYMGTSDRSVLNSELTCINVGISS